ncbi:MAG: ferritin-like domain-containing protein [Myxococcales bacterium]|nr:ferritin-like domain-containing protein [Myxococcales bacterium]
MQRLDLLDLGFAEGGHVLLRHALRQVAVGDFVAVRGTAPALLIHISAWCRGEGHVALEPGEGEVVRVQRGGAEAGRFSGAERAGGAGIDGVVEHPKASWGLAARGASVESGGPELGFVLSEKRGVWAEEAARLYQQGVAAQWDPNTAIDWTAVADLPAEVEDAVVQVMTYLIENETAALLVPARFLSQLHPHFREVMQLLALQTADEARHIEVFTRRALLNRTELGLSTVGGQASLKTLLDETDFALSSLLLGVLGEGSFLSLLSFLSTHGPDPITRQVALLAARDEARHVAFGMAHLERHLEQEPALLGRLRSGIQARHDSLATSAGLNELVYDALIVLAAGAWTPTAIRQGFNRVVELQVEMHAGRRRRLERLGFSDSEAETLSALHTRNFM